MFFAKIIYTFLVAEDDVLVSENSCKQMNLYVSLISKVDLT